MNKEIKRGQVWFYKPTVDQPGHIQKGPRPVIIVSNDVMNSYSPIVLAVPCTTRIKRNFPTHVLFILNDNVSVALAEQAGPICVDELDDCKMQLPPYVMEQIDNALGVAYGLKPMPGSTVPKSHCRAPKPAVEQVQPAVENKKPVKWTVSRMRKFLMDFSSLGSVDEVATKYGLTPSTANSYRSKFQMLVSPRSED